MSQRKNGKVKNGHHYSAEVELPDKERLCVKIRNSLI